MDKLFGYYTALVTPFLADGSVDIDTFRRLINRQSESGVNGIVICGSTGEAASLTKEEKLLLTREARAIWDNHLIVGVSAHSASDVIGLSNMVAELGADGLLVAPPAYVKPSQRAILNHYKEIHDNTNLPIIIYNIPGRTAVDISNDSIIELSKLDRIIALKDASGDLSRVLEVKLKTKDSFAQLSGDDETVAAFMAMGGDGCISVTSNIMPNTCAAMFKSWVDGDLKLFTNYRDKLAFIHRALFVESNPVPIKYVLGTHYVRPPLSELCAESKALLDAIDFKE